MRAAVKAEIPNFEKTILTLSVDQPPRGSIAE